jgi:hypothetical protein
MRGLYRIHPQLARPRKWNYLCISPSAQWRTAIIVEGICICRMGAVALVCDGCRAKTTWLKMKRLSLSGGGRAGRVHASVDHGSGGFDRAKLAGITLGRVKGWLAGQGDGTRVGVGKWRPVTRPEDRWGWAWRWIRSSIWLTMCVVL